MYVFKNLLIFRDGEQSLMPATLSQNIYIGKFTIS